MTAACSKICQHPGCWKSGFQELKRERCGQNICYVKNVAEQSKPAHSYDKKNEQIVHNIGQLPTYNILNLYKFGLPESRTVAEVDSDDDSNEDTPLPNWSSFKTDNSKNSTNILPQDLNPHVNNVYGDYIAKLWQRYKEVEKAESKGVARCRNDKQVNYLNIEMEDSVHYDDSHEKVYTWVPNTKPTESSSERDEERATLKQKLIDGDVFPSTHFNSTVNKERVRLRSPTGGQPYMLRATPHRLPPMIIEEMMNYFNFFDFMGMTPNNYVSSFQSQSYGGTMPSPLKTERLSLTDHSVSTASRKKIPTKTENRGSTGEGKESSINSVSGIESTRNAVKTLYIKDGIVLPKSPENVKTRKARTSLHLTRVSVPKKKIRRYPLFHHCSRSIKKAQLPDVIMEPLTSSERSSETSSSISIAELASGRKHSVSMQCSLEADETVLLPDRNGNSKCVSPCQSFSSERSKKRDKTLPPTISAKDSLSRIAEANEHQARRLVQRSSESFLAKRTLDKERNELIVQDPELTGRPSAIMISKASGSKSKVNEQITRVISPTHSTVSSEDFSIDKELIQRAYDKYQSFTPFKSPTASRHAIIGDQMRNGIGRIGRSPTPSARQLFPQSMHNLDQFLPKDGDSLKNKGSFIKRSLSPSRSMFIRQQKQPAQEFVPSEIQVAQAQMFSAKNKQQVLPARNQNPTENGLGALIAPTPSVIQQAPPCSPVADELVESETDHDAIQFSKTDKIVASEVSLHAETSTGEEVARKDYILSKDTGCITAPILSHTRDNGLELLSSQTDDNVAVIHPSQNVTDVISPQTKNSSDVIVAERTSSQTEVTQQVDDSFAEPTALQTDGTILDIIPPQTIGSTVQSFPKTAANDDESILLHTDITSLTGGSVLEPRTDSLTRQYNEITFELDVSQSSQLECIVKQDQYRNVTETTVYNSGETPSSSCNITSSADELNKYMKKESFDEKKLAHSTSVGGKLDVSIGSHAADVTDGNERPISTGSILQNTSSLQESLSELLRSDVELDDEIMRAMNSIDDFLSDDGNE